MSSLPPPQPRVTLDSEPELEIDYVTGKAEHMGLAQQDRICTFSLRAGPLCSHYLTILPFAAQELVGTDLKRYLLANLAFAFHTKTCENVR